MADREALSPSPPAVFWTQSHVSGASALEDAESDWDLAQVVFKGRSRGKDTRAEGAGTQARRLLLEDSTDPLPGHQLEVHSCPSQPSTPETRVFGIYKLAERIFTNMSPEDLLLNATRVCKQWHAVISLSLDLQRKLFFIPEEGQWAQHVKSVLRKGYFVEENDDSKRIEVTINLFMTSRLRKDLEALEGYETTKRGASTAHVNLPKQRKKALLREGASYCRMLACQPPLVSVHFLEAENERDELDRMYDAWEVAKQEEGVLIWDTILRQELRYRYKRKPVELEAFKKHQSGAYMPLEPTCKGEDMAIRQSNILGAPYSVISQKPHKVVVCAFELEEGDGSNLTNHPANVAGLHVKRLSSSLARQGCPCWLSSRPPQCNLPTRATHIGTATNCSTSERVSTMVWSSLRVSSAHQLSGVQTSNPTFLKRKASAAALELSAKRAGPGDAMSSASNTSAAELDPEHKRTDVATSSAGGAGDRNGAQRMFNIVELLESVLLELSFKDLLITMPQVCKHFKNVIDNSASIQQALFFQPLPGPEVHFFRGTGPEADYDGFFAVEEHAPKRVHVASNPLFGSAEQWLLRNIQYGHARYFVAGQSQIQAFERPEASWRRMLGSQPPVKALVFGSAAGKDHEFVVKKDDWLRVEDYILPKEQFSKLSCRFWSEESRFCKWEVHRPSQVKRVEYHVVECVACGRVGHTSENCKVHIGSSPPVVFRPMNCGGTLSHLVL
ncbi:hypothetical protein CKM354_001242300 [Cercospora kikuchii]|uniref:CCHC-type domain-containing protein n=1 Tax=Cercospora kikuchii TaxID=84275 RepID=A0A9P3L1U8_9PEZI|nr:uncharacterized protein CKM354_001242300 [Cercospora kikuchii]GIZ49393.1 hypothetical protein CKM354_001242300 [Cercospora kikuchii]